MDTVEMLKEKNRLTDNCKIPCKDCQKQTYLSKLLEIFPNVVLEDDGTPFSICPSILGLKDLKNCSGKCINCWNQEYKE